MNGSFVAISLMPGPIPNDEAVYHAKANHSWEEAETVAKEHVAHILVSVIGGSMSNKEAAELHVKVCATALKQKHATALDSLGTLFQPQYYIDLANALIKDMESFPIYNSVYFGVYQGSEENTTSLYTYGLQYFNKKEIEIVNSHQEPKVLYDFLVDIASYVIDSDVTLMDGETIGFTEEQKLPITVSKAVALDPNTETIKIEY